MQKTHFIDINCDLGEGFGTYKVANDRELMPWLSSCNIACGFHAGDPLGIYQAIEAAIENDVNIGAHPGYPDLMGFGRRKMEMTHEELYATIIYQVSALKGMTEACGGKLVHVKAHGALYNYSAGEQHLADILAKAILAIDPALKYVGLPGSCHEKAATAVGLTFVREGFADRRYQKDGSLVPRRVEGALLVKEDEVLSQLMSMVSRQEVTTHEGDILRLQADTFCVHGDNPNALNLLKTIKCEGEKMGLSFR